MGGSGCGTPWFCLPSQYQLPFWETKMGKDVFKQIHEIGRDSIKAEAANCGILLLLARGEPPMIETMAFYSYSNHVLAKQNYASSIWPCHPFCASKIKRLSKTMSLQETWRRLEQPATHWVRSRMIGVFLSPLKKTNPFIFGSMTDLPVVVKNQLNLRSISPHEILKQTRREKTILATVNFLYMCSMDRYLSQLCICLDT